MLINVNNIGYLILLYCLGLFLIQFTRFLKARLSSSFNCSTCQQNSHKWKSVIKEEDRVATFCDKHRFAFVCQRSDCSWEKVSETYSEIKKTNESNDEDSVTCCICIELKCVSNNEEPVYYKRNNKKIIKQWIETRYEKVKGKMTSFLQS